MIVIGDKWYDQGSAHVFLYGRYDAGHPLRSSLGTRTHADGASDGVWAVGVYTHTLCLISTPPGRPPAGCWLAHFGAGVAARERADRFAAAVRGLPDGATLTPGPAGWVCGGKPLPN